MFATTVVTAVTAQNTAEVTAVHPVPDGGGRRPARRPSSTTSTWPPSRPACWPPRPPSDWSPTGPPTGDLPDLVVDPVMVASTGRRLLDDDAVAAYRDALVPQALVVTPNLLEAAILAGVEPAGGRPTSTTMVDLAARIHRLGPTWVLVKGGHLPGVHGADGGPAPDRVADVLFDGTDVVVLDGTGSPPATTTAPGAAWPRPPPPCWPPGDDVPDRRGRGQGVRPRRPRRGGRLGPRAGARPPRPVRLVRPVTATRRRRRPRAGAGATEAGPCDPASVSPGIPRTAVRIGPLDRSALPRMTTASSSTVAL